MTAQEYFNQAYKLDQRINSKIEQLEKLNDLAHKATATYTGMPQSPNKGAQTMANTIDRIIDLQNEINQDIDTLVDLKVELRSVIEAVDSTEYRLILEERYLNWKSWEQLAVSLGYTLRHLHRLHREALDSCIIPQK